MAYTVFTKNSLFSLLKSQFKSNAQTAMRHLVNYERLVSNLDQCAYPKRNIS